MAIGSSPSPLDSVTSGVARADNSDSEEERQVQLPTLVAATVLDLGSVMRNFLICSRSLVKKRSPESRLLIIDISVRYWCFKF